MLCPRPLCVEACPARNDIPGFIGALARGELAQAAETLARTSTFPEVCGRVCDHARQCEGACVVGRRGQPLAIGALERFVGDWASAQDQTSAAPPAAASGHRVAVVGSGPAGLAAAEALARSGHRVTIFEALPTLGGILAWGIPSFRLPDDVLRRLLDRIAALGVEWRLSTPLGPDRTATDLLDQGFSAVFLAIGAGQPVWPGLPGERLPGVLQANEFLARVKLSRLAPLAGFQAPVIGQRVVVIGAGNTAMDAAQTARRLGAAQVTVVYRRSAAEVPARSEEVESAREEGVQFRFLAAPTAFQPGPDGRLAAVEGVEMELGAPGPDGRPRPVPKPASAWTQTADTALLALGFRVDGAALARLQRVERDAIGRVVVDPASSRTTHPDIWAGGDLVAGPDTVVSAMAWGRRAAADIHRVLAERAAKERREEPTRPSADQSAAGAGSTNRPVG